VAYFRYFHAEEDLWCYYDVADDGAVLRHVEVRAGDGCPVTAASLAEVLHLRDTADLAAMRSYETRFGVLAEAKREDWVGAPVQEISAAAFERAWAAARTVLEAAVTE
jgi:hypothetical protein